MTTLFTLSWMGEKGERCHRHLQWLEMVVKMKASIGWDKLLVIDDGSHPDFLKDWIPRCQEVGQILSFIHLGRKAPHVYPYQWRGVVMAKAALRTCDKLIWIETDFRVLSPKMEKWIKMASGFVSPWCDIHKIPETACMIIGGEGRSKFLGWETPTDYEVEMKFEEVVPLSAIERSLKGDRWPEVNEPIPQDADFVAQFG